MSEREIFLYPTPAASWLALKLSTAGYQIFGKFQSAGSLSSCLVTSVPSTVSILWLAWAFIALCSSTKLPTTLLKFMIACSTGDEDGGGCGWDEDPYCCCAAGGTYGGGFSFQERLGWFLQLGLYELLYGAVVGGLYWPTVLACIGPQYWLVQPSYPLLKE